MLKMLGGHAENMEVGESARVYEMWPYIAVSFPFGSRLRWP